MGLFKKRKTKTQRKIERKHKKYKRNKKKYKPSPQKFDYQLLSRLKSDCDYFLGNGNGHEKHLWSGNVEKQISKMESLYKKLKKKPKWLPKRQIRKYKKLMMQKKYNNY